MGEFRMIGARTIAEEAFLRLDRATVATPNGETVTRVVVSHPGAVAVVPILDDDVFLFEQHRTPLGRNLLEIPAGKLDVPGEDRKEAARRELEEEIGFVPGLLVHLTDLITSPGFCDEVITIYRATDLERVASQPVGVEEEYATIVRMPITEAVDRVRAGEITDAKTVVGLLLSVGR